MLEISIHICGAKKVLLEKNDMLTLKRVEYIFERVKIIKMCKIKKLIIG
tara:strand:+ start:180 stop:326 length:147 start_codon:yes stop_codon:yes gene_type:complete